jgi:3-oxoacyl-[acyl-carrier-protein] synthase II
MTKHRVVVTGIGVVSPVGTGVEKFWKSLVEGKSGVRTITAFDPSQFDARIAGEVTDYDPLQYFSTKEARNLARFVQFASVASKEAMKMSKLDSAQIDPDRFGVLIGSGIGSIETIEHEYQKYLEKGPSRISPHFIPKIIINEAAGQVSIDIGARGPATCVATACSTATNAIGDAFRFIQYGDADIMIAGGTESATTVLGVGGFCALKALSQRNDAPEKASRPFDLNRDGFVMAEGAGVVILESLEHAKKRGAPILAEMVGYGRTSDAFHITAPESSGAGAAKAMELAIKDAGMTTKDISYINAHGTSTSLNDKVETLAIKTVFKDLAKKVPISSTKSMTGHLLGAAGGVEFAACVLAIRDNIIPPTINYETPDPECDLDYVPNKARKAEVTVAMSNSLGFGGHNASVIVKKFKE